MSGTKAMLAGAWRALASPFVLAWLWLLQIAVAGPAALRVAGAIERGIGRSRFHEPLRSGFDMEWFTGFARGARGLAATFTPTHSGAGGFYENLEGVLRGRIFVGPPVVLLLGIVFVLLWLLMQGGVIDRYADRESKAGIKRFFGKGWGFVFRFVRLALLSGMLYGGIYWMCYRMERWISDSTRDVTVEGTVFYYHLLIWALTALLLTLVHACFGFAKVATVVDERRSMLFAAARGIAFVARYPTKALGLYYGYVLAGGMLLVLFAMIAPGAGQETREAVIRAFIVAQLFLLAKLYLRQSLLAGQVALYQAFPASEPGAEPVAPLEGPAPGDPVELWQTNASSDVYG